MLVRGGWGKKLAFMRTSLRVLPRRMKLAIRQYPPQDGSDNRTKHCIVLHGWGLDASGMQDMCDAMRHLPQCAGRRFWNISYDTQWTPFHTTADLLIAELKNQPFDFEDVIFVAYSMGGVVARSMISKGFPCRALLSICTPHNGPLKWLTFPGPRTLSNRSAAMRALNSDPLDKAHRDRYHLFAITYRDALGTHSHDGLVARRSALGKNLGEVASRHVMHLRYSHIAWYDPHWRGKLPQYMPEALHTIAAIEEGKREPKLTEEKMVVNESDSSAADEGVFSPAQLRTAQRSRTRFPKANPGDILLFKRARGLNRMITWFTKSRFYHVGIFEGGTNVIEARPRGVVRRDLNGPDGDRAFTVIPAPEGKGEQALNWAKGQIGDGYDPIDVFVIILETIFKNLKLNYSSDNKYSCGEFVATAYQEAGIDLFPGQEPARTVPADFEKYLPWKRRKRKQRN